jgi:hypothetical protein
MALGRPLRGSSATSPVASAREDQQAAALRDTAASRAAARTDLLLRLAATTVIRWDTEMAFTMSEVVAKHVCCRVCLL